MAIWIGKTLQIWQYSPPTAAERTLGEACDLAQQYGFSGVMVKAFDGHTWMGDVDGSTDAIRNFQQIANQRHYCESRGLGYAIWVNPLYGGAEYLEKEAWLYAGGAREAGIIGWDTEPYVSFWGPNRPAGAAMNLMEQFATQAPGVTSVWQPDPRPARLAELRPEEWAPFMTVYQPQVYWTDFQTDPVNEVERGLLQAHTFGLEYAPTLPGNATPGDLQRAIGWLGAAGVTGAVLWRMGSMGAGQLAVVRDTPLASEPVPAPPSPVPPAPPEPPQPPGPDLAARVEALEVEMAATVKQLDRLEMKGTESAKHYRELARIGEEP